MAHIEESQGPSSSPSNGKSGSRGLKDDNKTDNSLFLFPHRHGGIQNQRQRSWTADQIDQPHQLTNLTTTNDSTSQQQQIPPSLKLNRHYVRRSTIHNIMATPRLPTLPEHNNFDIFSIDCLRHFEPFNNETDILNYPVPLDELDPDDLYSTFRSRVALKRLFTDENQCWLYYDSGIPLRYINRTSQIYKDTEDRLGEAGDQFITKKYKNSSTSQNSQLDENRSNNTTLTDIPRERQITTDVIQEFRLINKDGRNYHEDEDKYCHEELPNKKQEKKDPHKRVLPDISPYKNNSSEPHARVLIFLPAATETADTFYKQILELSKFYRCLSVFWPDYWTIEDFNFGFRTFLDSLNIKRVHLFGSNLGGFLSQKFAASFHGRNRVLSIILFSSWIDTNVFGRSGAAPFYWMMPKLALTSTVLSNSNQESLTQQPSSSTSQNSSINLHGTATPKSTASRDELRAESFVSERLSGMTQSELASRLTLNYSSDYVNPTHMPSNIPITIMELFERYDLNNTIHLGLHKLYPTARVAFLKSGGDYPYLVRAADVNIHINTHMNHFYKEN